LRLDGSLVPVRLEIHPRVKSLRSSYTGLYLQSDLAHGVVSSESETPANPLRQGTRSIVQGGIPSLDLEPSAKNGSISHSILRNDLWRGIFFLKTSNLTSD
jgi:hypothetical protein